MSEINYEMLIEKYETLVLLIDDLQAKFVKLTNFYEQVKEKYNIYDSEVEKTLAEVSELRQSALSDIALRKKETEKSINDAALEIRKLVRQATEVSNELNESIKEAKATKIQIPNFEERLKNVEVQLRAGGVNITNKYIALDYDEVLTGTELWEKYNGKTYMPIIVQCTSWSGDYCMVVTEYDQEKVRLKGRVYLNGEQYDRLKQSSFSASRPYKLYKSPNENAILENEKRYTIGK